MGLRDLLSLDWRPIVRRFELGGRNVSVLAVKRLASDLLTAFPRGNLPHGLLFWHPPVDAWYTPRRGGTVAERAVRKKRLLLRGKVNGV